MSASSKKKLRKEAEAALLTEKQKRERKEARKLKAITISFIAIMLAVVLIVVGKFGFDKYEASGIKQKRTIAAVVGNQELNSVQVNYYFTDHIQNLYSQWQSTYGSSVSMYMGMMGLDFNSPLNQQTSMFDPSQTWADYFLDAALEKARTDYALYEDAKANGFQLPEADRTALNDSMQMLDIYATFYQYSSADEYLESIYGYGAEKESFAEYSEICAIASAYYNAHSEELKGSYNDAAIREYEKDKFDNYSSFSYALYNVTVEDYLPEGTTDENGNVTYTDEQREEARKKAEEIANQLKSATSLEEFDKAITELEINKEKDGVSSTKNDLVKYTDLPEKFQEWMASKDRVNGDLTVIANENKTTDAEGKETTTITGYYVLGFMERNDNTRYLANVSHLLVAFEGGTTDSSTGKTTYSETEKAKAKTEAERLLNLWKEGDATLETFKEFVKEHTDDTGSKETGGLYEGIHAESNYVENFLNWSIDPDRKTGDTGIIVSDYGYHIMYYVGDDTTTTYRDTMIIEDMLAEDLEEWYNSVTATTTYSKKETKYVNLGLVLAALAS